MKYAPPFDRIFAAALGISILFHLSMVTVFSIVIFFPRENIEYYTFSIYDVGTRSIHASAPREVLRIPSLEDAFAEMSTSQTDLAPKAPLAGLPPIDLPTLEFAELDRVRAGEEAQVLGRRYDRLLARRPRDPWARFGEELESLGGALSRLTTGRTRSETDRPTPATRPAPGFVAYIEWMNGPKDRKLLYAPPIEALWELEPGELAANIVLVFKIDTSGRVIEVMNRVGDAGGIETRTALALSKYRFEPWMEDRAVDQRGTLILTTEAAAGAFP